MYYNADGSDGAILMEQFAKLDPHRVLDCTALQSILDDLHAITGITLAIVDNHGDVLVKTGWQDICEFFHRKNEDCQRICQESDTKLTRNILPGEFKLYQCHNHLWDVATPLLIGGVRLATLYFGQFVFRDNEPDINIFREQAAHYGFDETAYLHALESVPRYTYDQVARIMNFLTKFATMISSLNHHKALVEEHYLEREELLKDLKMHSLVLEHLCENVIVTDLDGYITYVNNAECKTCGIAKEELIGKHISILLDEPGSQIMAKEMIDNTLNAGLFEGSFVSRYTDGKLCQHQARLRVVKDATGVPIGIYITTVAADPPEV